jgi:hypothetical protein
MQGNARSSRREHRALEVELVKERAEALGRVGRRLEAAVTAYQVASAADGGALPADMQDALLRDIASELYRLVLQRECCGARHGNLEAICIAYDVPEEAIRRM